MIISCPILHCGHSAIPSFGELVPKIMYFFFLQNRKGNHLNPNIVLSHFLKLVFFSLWVLLHYVFLTFFVQLLKDDFFFALSVCKIYPYQNL